MKLWLRVAFLSTALVALATIAVGAVTAARQAEALRRALDERGTTLARNLAARGQDALARGDAAALATLLDLWEEDELLEAAFLDAGGRVIAARAFPAPPSAHPFVCTYPVNLPAAPAAPDDFDRTIGLVRVTLSTVRLDTETAAVARTTATIVGVALVAAILVAFLLARLVTGPLERLVAATRRVGAGDLAARVDPRGGPELSALAASFNDMTAALASLEQTKEALTRMIVHDLKNPLGSMLSGLDLLDRERMPSEDREVHATVVARGRALLGLIGDLLDARRLQEGKMPVRAEAIDLHRLASAVAKDLSLEAREIGSSIRVDGEPGARALADPVLLRRVIENLLSNALRHHPSGRGPVVIDLSADPVQVRVRDQGPGIAAADRARVFEMFVRAADAAPSARRNAGVGLAFCKLAMTAMNGTIRVADPAGGTGTTLELALPSAPPHDLA